MIRKKIKSCIINFIKHIKKIPKIIIIYLAIKKALEDLVPFAECLSQQATENTLYQKIIAFEQGNKPPPTDYDIYLTAFNYRTEITNSIQCSISIIQQLFLL